MGVTKISWTASFNPTTGQWEAGRTFNPWWGCIRVSPGCEHCYAEVLSHRWGHKVWGTNDRRFMTDKYWAQALRWNKYAESQGMRLKVFCGSMCDIGEINLHGDGPAMDEARERLFALIENTPHLDWLLLTKRIETFGGFVPGGWHVNGWPDNVWMGTSVEDQRRADFRIPRLAKLPAKIRFVSFEPLLGPVNLYPFANHPKDAFDWGIVGGESQPGCRPMEIEWAAHLVSQMRAMGNVTPFVKQLGGHPNKRDNVLDFPTVLQVQEFPDVTIPS